ncbi:hypothetical protein BDV24DRAFT_151762 [Aspergillus arachidicola]|uniref:Uncharacterized protein n=1 Tax=Aspergillus arachidicola TaxID=656916 RepID=A0A5N6Y5B2_9EURO|nr:hypothetical protein BDV24DRAFT_151762 [Aspergillus arachidicola]
MLGTRRCKDDLTITGVVDMKWVYAGPAQLFGSAPWWPLMDRPVNEEWDFEEKDAPDATDRYFKYLEIFIWVLSDEEDKMTGNGRKELTELRMKDNMDTEEVITFVASKLEDLAACEKIKDKVERFKALMDSKEITTIDFISSICALLRSD